MGVKVNIFTDEQRLRPENSEVERLWADNQKAKSLLGWKPQFGGTKGFRHGIEKTVEWFVAPNHLKIYKSDQYNL